MRSRGVWPCVVAIPVVLACSSAKQAEQPTGQAHGGATASGPVVTTRQMSEALTGDVHASEHELSALEDSIYQRIGDTVSVLLKQARTSWETYRKQECDAIRIEFAQGSMAPVAQLECWVDLTDDRRRFLSAEYNFARPPRSSAPGRLP